MTNENKARVLNRMGAHELTPEEMDKIFGGGDRRVSTVATGTQTLPVSNPDFDFDE